MIENFVVPELTAIHGIQLNERFRNLWWCQDGAPAHRSLRARETLRHYFGDRIVGLGHDIEWPPRSPDLTPCDFFLWGFVKSKVYVTPPQSIDDLSNRIRAAIRDIPADMIRRSVRSMLSRAELCIRKNGFHIEGRSGLEYQ